MATPNSLLKQGKKEIVSITRLEEILEHTINKISSIDNIIVIKRYDLAKNPVPIKNGRYQLSDDVRVGYDNYKSHIVLNKEENKEYILRAPFLKVFLQAQYHEGFSISDGKIQQTPKDLNLVPYDPDLVDFLFRSQLIAQADLLIKLTDAKPDFWIEREGIFQYSKPIDINAFKSAIITQEKLIEYDEADPNNTIRIVPGQSLMEYTKDYGFSNVKDQLLQDIRKLKIA